MAINKPGVRENPDGTLVIQMAKRSDQLEGIADKITDMLSATDSATTLRSDQVHTIKGYMEQLRIIADELK